MTRKQLIDFILKAWENQDEDFPKSFECIADDLIKEGFCKVDEPREFWVNKEGSLTYIYEHNDFGYREGSEIIHVREVVEE